MKTSTALRFYHEVVGLDHLHYGLWDGDPIDLDGLRVAQERYVLHLLDLVPSGVRSVLDVGGGTGAVASRFWDAGYEIEGVSPDPYLNERFRERLPFAACHLARFQEFEPTRRYDLVLMSESAQYVWLDHLFPSVARAAPGGHLLVADYFTVPEAADDGGPLAESGHRLDAFLAEAKRWGFRLEHREDVTDRVTPTLEIVRRWIERFGEPTVRLAADVLAARYPRLWKLARRLFGNRWRRLERRRAIVDPEAFARAKRYLMLRFRVPAGPRAADAPPNRP